MRALVDDTVARRRWLQRALSLELFSLGWMTAEGIVGVAAGASSRSLSLEVFGLDSLIELISAWTVLWRLRTEMEAGSLPPGLARVEAAEQVKAGLALDSAALREDGVGNLACGGMAVILTRWTGRAPRRMVVG